MARYSLSNLLAKRRRIRIVSVLSLLLLIGALGSIIISKNPKGIKGINNGGANPSEIITKNLYPVSRNGVSCPLTVASPPVPSSPSDPACFNPYALQVNDIIEVAFSATGTGGVTYTLTDNLLTLPGSNYVCAPTVATSANSFPTPGAGNWNSTILSWTTSTVAVYYQCKVTTCTLSGGQWSNCN